MNIATIILSAFSAALAAGIYFYNRLIKLKNLMEEAYSGIDVQLKRRHDLIPNLIETVKGYQFHERKTLEDVTQLRTQIAQTYPRLNLAGLENDLSRALRSVFAIAENYPDLKADKNFLSLQTSLSEIEDQLQLARRYYNGTVRNYNIDVQSFPSNFVAGAFTFKRSEFFEIEYATERKSPDVKFN
jgi:LemA protein